MTSETTNWKAVQFIIISTICFTGLNALIKYLQAFPAFELVFFRSVGSSALCFIYLKSNNIPVWGNKKSLLLTRGLCGVTSMSLFFLALQLIPLGTTVSLRYLSPIFATILAIFILSEKVRPIQWLFFAMAFGGVVMLKGFQADINLLGLVYVLGAAFFSGLVYIIIRKIGQSEHPVIIVNYFMFTGTIVGGLLAIPQWENPSGPEWFLLLSTGLFGFFGQLFMTKAFQIELANKIAPFKYLESVFALIVGWAWFGESYSFLALVGIALIIGGMLFNVLIKK